MIKKFLWIYALCLWFVLLIAVNVSWSAGMMMVGGGVGTAGGCDACTGGLIFSAYWETDSDITNGSPCGCGSDTTGDLTGAASTVTGEDGYISTTNGEDYYTYGITFPASGSFLAKISMVTHATGTEFFKFYYDNNNYLSLAAPSTSDLKLDYHGNATSSAATLNSDELPAGTDRWAVGRWRTGSTNPSIALTIYSVDDESQVGTASTATDLTAMTSIPIYIYVGNHSAVNGAVRIYKLKIWDTYDGAPSSGF